MSAAQMSARGQWDDSAPGTVVVQSKRRWVEFFLLIVAWGLGFSGYVLTGLNIDGVIPPDWRLVGGLWLGLIMACHIVVRIFIPYADPMILPIVFTLNGIGLAMIHRIDLIPAKSPERAINQSIWTLGGVILWAVIVVLLKDHRKLQRFPYVLFLAGLVMMLMPLVPGLGTEINGARLWISLAGFTFQPAEIAKVLLVLAFAAYLVDKRDVLSLAGKKIGPVTFPRARDLGPIVIMWIAAMLVIVYQKDIGTAMLFFGLIVVMLYVATERVGWVVLGVLGFILGAVAAYFAFGHIRIRFDAWLDPFSNFDQNDQIIKAQYGMAWGGLAGRGWGLGRPGLTTFSWSDFIAASVGEELGVTGLMGIIVLYALLVTRGLRAALACRDAFGKMLATGLATVMAIQVTAIIGGVTRMLPLTGLTTPFMSQGGSSEVANWAIVGVIMLVSHQARQPADQLAANVDSEAPPVLDDQATDVIPRHAGGGAR